MVLIVLLKIQKRLMAEEESPGLTSEMYESFRMYNETCTQKLYLLPKSAKQIEAKIKHMSHKEVYA